MPQVRANGIDIEYESFGRASDPLILLIMGFAAQLIFWPEALCERLAAKGFRVVRFDNRDVGKSTHLVDLLAPDPRALVAEVMAGKRPDVPYTLDDMADDAIELMDALRAKRAHIVGASMGGMIAQLIAINHPARAKSLISIMSTTGRRDLPPGNRETLSVLFRPPISDGRDDLIDTSILVQKALSSPGFPVGEAEMRAIAERRTDRAPFDAAGLARQSAALIAAPPRNALLREVRCPTLVLHGADDLVIPAAAAKDTADSIPGAELIVVPGMGHDFGPALVPVYLKHIGDFVSKVEAERFAAE
ncbi:MAG TPA: alpha/beta fold hydrolase [Roseiarcus sp.]|nr:alpha/beta fold hydrolase [Roseiarcus sp.]